MAQNYQELKKALHFDLLDEVARLKEGLLLPDEAEDLIARLASAIQEFPCPPLTTVFVEAVRAVPNLRPRPDTVLKLAPLPQRVGLSSDMVRAEALRLLSNVAPENFEARRICQENLSHYDQAIYGFAALGLARSGDLREEVWIKLSASRWTPDFIRAATREFVQSASPAAVELMFDWLSGKATDWENDEKYELPYVAADLLLEMGKEKEVVEFLLPRLRAENDFPGSYWSQLAREKLLNTSLGAPQAVEAFIPIVSSYCSSAMILHEAGKADERVIQILLSWLQDENREALWHATDALMMMGRNDPEIADALRRMIDVRLNRDNKLHRAYAVQSLIKLGQVDDQLVEVIISMLPESIAGWGCSNFDLLHLDLGSLRGLHDADERIVHALLPYLSGEYDNDQVYVSYEVARLLLDIGKAENEAITALTKLLEHEDIAFNVAALLVKKGQATEIVEAKLRLWLNNEHSQDRFESAQSLHQMGKMDESVLKCLLSFMGASAEQIFPVFSKIMQEQPLSANEILSLRNSLQDTETPDQYSAFQARELIFEWLFKTLESQDMESRGYNVHQPRNLAKSVTVE